MNVERKFTSLKDLKVTDDGPGTIEGYRSVFGVIDEGGDIVVKGAFADTLSEYLHGGFTAQAHDWDFKEAVGFPLDAYEDDHGWFVKSQFHSTPDAQLIRTKAKERMEAGKQVSFSFGYAPKKYIHIEAKDYEEELPKYIKADLLPAMLKKAQEFNRIRVLKSVEAIEDSIVTAPMNKRAAATGVKSDETKTIRKCKPEDTEPGKPWCLYSADGDKLLGRHATREECVAQEEAIQANKPKSLTDQEIKAILDQATDDFYLKVIAASESFESFDKAASAALRKFIDNMQRNHEARVKEGRVLSASNRATVQKCKDSLVELMGDLDALLTMSEPKPKEKEIDVEALRTQSLRLRSQVMLTLAQPSG